MSAILTDLQAAAAKKWRGDLACQQAGLFARAAAEIERLTELNASQAQMIENYWRDLARYRAEIERMNDVLRACQRHLACNAVTSDLVELYERVREVLDGPDVEVTGLRRKEER